MKKIFCITAFFSMAVTVCSHAMDQKSEPKAVFEKITVDFKAKEDGIDGMMLHLRFTVHDMKDIESSVAVYFLYNDYHRSILKDTNQKYYSGSGDVAVYKNIKPAHNPALFEDLQIFMPYSELDLWPGNYDLMMDVKLIQLQGGEISKLTQYAFNFTKPLPNSSFIPSASVDSVFTEHNITENNKTGTRITLLKFSVVGMKNTDAYLAVYFEKKDRTKLKSTNSAYQTQSGQTALFQTLTLPYDNSVWEKLTLFIPYEEFGLGKGKHDLRMDVDAIYKNGALLKHMRFHEFQVEL